MSQVETHTLLLSPANQPRSQAKKGSFTRFEQKVNGYDTSSEVNTYSLVYDAAHRKSTSDTLSMQRQRLFVTLTQPKINGSL